MHYILKNDTLVKDIIIEVYFEEVDFGTNLTEHCKSIVQLIVNGYNLLEPEHSISFPLVSIDILLPQLFSTRSVILTDSEIRHVYFNEQTNTSLVDALLSERNAS